MKWNRSVTDFSAMLRLCSLYLPAFSGGSLPVKAVMKVSVSATALTGEKEKEKKKVKGKKNDKE